VTDGDGDGDADGGADGDADGDADADADGDGDVDSNVALSYKPEYDIASAKYVVYAFVLGMPHLSVPWAEMLGELLIETRRLQINVE
jgi:hypothetical protein